MNTKHVNNLYSFSFMVNNVEYSTHLKRVIINKDVTRTQFTVDKYVFNDKATDLFDLILSKVEVKISHNVNEHYVPIFSLQGLISKVVLKNGEIVVFIESEQKISWLRKNGVSLTTENSTLDSAFKKYVKKIDEFYKHKNQTAVIYNYNKNINKFAYENLLFPIKDNHFAVAQSLLKTYFILNAPFYFFIDDYNFTDKQHPVTVNFYDLTNIKSLRAVMFDDLNSDMKPVLQGSGTYYNSGVYFNVDKIQKIYNLITGYGALKSDSQWNSENRFMYAGEPDSVNNAKQRLDLMKQFYKKAVKYYKYALTDIDITKFIIGNRFVEANPSAVYQYSQAIVEAEYRFYAVNRTDIIKNSGKNGVSMMVTVNMTAISY